MAHPESLENLPELKNIKDDLLPVSRGAVYIKDPKKHRRCPLCQQNLYLYNINYEEMFLMCENSMCEFPFGYEALQVVREESELQEKPLKATKDFFEYPTLGENKMHQTIDSILGAPTGTLSSMSGFSDTDGLSQMGDSDDMSMDRQEIFTFTLSKQELKRRQQHQKNKDVENSLSRIKELTKEMNKLAEEPELDKKGIKNQKWLKTLKVWEVETGRKLLTDKENIELVKSEPKSSENELQVSIDATSENSDSPTVKIQILNIAKDEDRITSTDCDMIKADQ